MADTVGVHDDGARCWVGLSAELRMCVRPFGVCVGFVPAGLFHMLAAVYILIAVGEALVSRSVWQGGAIFASNSNLTVISSSFDSNTAVCANVVSLCVP